MAKEKQVKQKVQEKKIEKKDKKNKKGLWTKIRIFFAGVKSEFKKVHWPSKANMLKYSIATFVFIVFLSLFFYAIEIIFALIQTLLK